MKTLKVLLVVMLAAFSYTAVSAQGVHHKKHHHHHHHMTANHH